MISKEVITERQQAVANAIANQRLEGLEPEAKAVDDLTLFAEGKCEIEDVLARFQQRIASGEIFR